MYFSFPVLAGLNISFAKLSHMFTAFFRIRLRRSRIRCLHGYFSSATSTSSCVAAGAEKRCDGSGLLQPSSDCAVLGNAERSQAVSFQGTGKKRRQVFPLCLWTVNVLYHITSSGVKFLPRSPLSVVVCFI